MSKSKWPPLSSKTLQVDWCELCVNYITVRDEVDEWPWCKLGYDKKYECKENNMKYFTGQVSK